MYIIEPIQSWDDGNIAIASLLNVFCSHDNLKDKAEIQYQLLNIETKKVIKIGVKTMIGIDYENWVDNKYAYDWLAKEINLTIISEYVETTTTTTTTTITETEI